MVKRQYLHEESQLGYGHLEYYERNGLPIHSLQHLCQCEFLHTRCAIYRVPLYGRHGDAMPASVAGSEYLYGGHGRPDRLPNGHGFNRCGIVRTSYRILRQQLDDHELFHDDDSLGWSFFLHGGGGELIERLHSYKLQPFESGDHHHHRDFLHGIVGNGSQ